MEPSLHTAPAEAQKRLVGSVARQKPANLLRRIFSRSAVKSIIGDKRERCVVVGVMVLIDKSVPLDGMVMALDAHGALFRPASTYILDRGRVDVLLRFADREVRGVITSVSVYGYSIAFQNPLAEIDVDDVLNQFGARNQAQVVTSGGLS